MLEAFVQTAAPWLYLSAVVAAELRAGAKSLRDMDKLENTVFRPYARRGRVVTPSTAAWDMLGRTLAWFVKNEGAVLRTTPKSFIFDILLAYSCREVGAILISSNERDFLRIRKVFSFEFSTPYPDFR